MSTFRYGTGGLVNRRKFVQNTLSLAVLGARADGLFPEMADSNSQDRAVTSAARPGARCALTLDRVLNGRSPAYTEEFLLADVRPEAVRRFTEFSGDLSGRYIGALATAAQAYGMEFPGLDTLVEKVVALQKPEGYFGAAFHPEKLADADLALLWGNGRLLVGLLEYQRFKPSATVLASCRRLGDWLVAIGPLMLSTKVREEFGAQHFASSYICWTQQTEGLALLFAATKDGRYRQLAAQVARVIQRRPGDHVHGYLSSLRGVMDLHSATGEDQFLRQCEAAWDDVSASKDALITGGVPEGWSPNNHRTEGCAEADWARLNLQLWKATAKPRYLETAERASFNELAFNQFATGDFGHRVYTETGFGSGAARAWWCCTLHGLRAFPDIDASVFRATEDGLSYDSPMDGRIEGHDFSASASSSLGLDGTVRIRVKTAGPHSFALRMRIPAWSQEVQIEVNGTSREATPTEGYAVIKRVWTDGDVVTVRYAMKLRAEGAPDGRVAYWYGPWLLGAGALDNPEYFNELTTENRLLTGMERSLPSNQQPSRAFTVPIAAVTVPCTFAEYPDQPGSVLLRAIAEQAGQSTTAWELRFLRRQEADRLGARS